MCHFAGAIQIEKVCQKWHTLHQVKLILDSFSTKWWIYCVKINKLYAVIGDTPSASQQQCKVSYSDTPGPSFSKKRSQVNNHWYKVCHFWHTFSIYISPANNTPILIVWYYIICIEHFTILFLAKKSRYFTFPWLASLQFYTIQYYSVSNLIKISMNFTGYTWFLIYLLSFYFPVLMYI